MSWKQSNKMPTIETKIANNIVKSEWMKPLKSAELVECFATLGGYLDKADTPLSVLFDVENVISIPSQAPFLFLRAGITKNPKLDRMAVIGTDPIAQILAQMAVKMTSQNILFFASEADALKYLAD